MENKYNMTKEENIFVAKRNIVDYIWKSANLEGISVTYPDTHAIFDGLSVQGYKVDDIIAVNNLKKSWKFILDNLDYSSNFNFLCEVNKIVGEGIIINAGKLRSVPVKMGGTSWIPDFPIETIIKEDLENLLKIENHTDRGITIMLWGMRKQMFLDGNKRTSMLFANKVMIENGCGVISVPIDLQPDFRKLLIDFYESNNMDEIKTFVYSHCIDGIPFERDMEEPPNTGTHFHFQTKKR